MTQQLDSMAELLNAQQQDHIKHRLVSADERRKRLQQVIDVVVAHHQEFVEAMELDFAGRSQGFSVMNDILGSLASLKYARDHLDSWMGSDNRQVFSPYDQLGSTARIEYQAKGSVGIIGTWNAPLYTLLSPLACVLAAGNRAILKPSEVTSKTADVLASVFAKELDPLIVGVINGGVKVGVEFSHLPFDHLIFTGSSAVGKKIMQAAAQNLVPVTLEL
ncbi:aldehyde dehydrogenase family protein, partial [Glaciecola sp.]|nr:aldehyde dehydrogenase family protein [Glaciecola sp.]